MDVWSVYWRRLVLHRNMTFLLTLFVEPFEVDHLLQQQPQEYHERYDIREKWIYEDKCWPDPLLIIKSLETSVRPGEYRSKREHYKDRNGHQNDFSSDLPFISNLRAFNQSRQLLCVVNSVDTEDKCWQSGQYVASKHARVGTLSIVYVAIYKLLILHKYHDHFDDLSKNTESCCDKENVADTL